MENERRRERILHNVLLMDREIAFCTTRKANHGTIGKPLPPMSIGDPYMESWANPMLMRGVPESTKQLMDRAQTRSSLPTFVKAPETPFYLSWNGNKSSTLPNGVFDVIADAIESGGVTKRHLGTSARFGLSNNCDNRPLGPLPAAPTRVTSLRPARRYNSLKMLVVWMHMIPTLILKLTYLLITKC